MLNVIIVDDEAAGRSTLREFCEAEADLQVLGEYGDPAAALVAVQAKPPQLLFLDIQMGPMNGIDLAIRLKAELPGLRLTLISGQAVTTGLLEHARRDGYDLDIVAKPVHPSTLLNLMASHRMN